MNIRFLVIPLFFALCACSKREFDMPSRAMEPTIPVGSTVVVDFSAYEEKEIERSDLVCFLPDEYPEKVFVFRVAGLPHETLSLKDSTIFADGEATGIDGVTDTQWGALAGSVVLAADEFYVLGDNTTVARDSRFFEAIRRSQILGKVIKVQPADGGNDG